MAWEIILVIILSVVVLVELVIIIVMSQNKNKSTESSSSSSQSNVKAEAYKGQVTNLKKQLKSREMEIAQLTKQLADMGEYVKRKNMDRDKSF